MATPARASRIATLTQEQIKKGLDEESFGGHVSPRVRESSRIDHDTIHTLVPCFMNTIDQRALPITLERIKGSSSCRDLGPSCALDIRETGRAVDARFPGTEEVEVWSVQEEDGERGGGC